MGRPRHPRGGGRQPRADALITGPASGVEGALIALHRLRHGSGEQAANDSITLAWTVSKDGQMFASGFGAGVPFTPDDDGPYLVNLVASDEDGGQSSFQTTVGVANVARVASADRSGPRG